MTPQLTLILTAIAVLLFVFLNWAFVDGKFSLSGDRFFAPTESDGITVLSNSTLWTYVALLVIILAGYWQYSRLTQNGSINITPEQSPDTPGQIEDPWYTKLLFGNSAYAILWLPLRLFLGIEWAAAGEHKVRDAAWRNGDALAGYWERVAAIPEPPQRPSIHYDWYRDFINFMLDNEWYTWFGPLIAWGELLVGLGLILGAFTAIAAFFGSMMNFSFILAGSTSSNPVLIFLTGPILVAWRIAGHWGLDRWLLAAVGVPGRRGWLLGKNKRS